MTTLIVIVGGTATVLLLLNALLSFRERADPILSWIRLQFAVLSALATVIVLNVMEVLR